MGPIQRTVAYVACAVGISAAVHAGEHIKLDAVPPVVKQTIEREIKGGSIHEIERDVEKGKTIYEVEYTKVDGIRWELQVSSSGAVLKHHRD